MFFADDLGGIRGNFNVGVEGPTGESDWGVIAAGGCGGGRRGRVRTKETGELMKRERGEVGTIEGVGIKVKDGFSVGGCGSGDHRFRNAGADDDQVEGGRLDRRVRRSVFAHGGTWRSSRDSGLLKSLLPSWWYHIMACWAGTGSTCLSIHFLLILECTNKQTCR